MITKRTLLKSAAVLAAMAGIAVPVAAHAEETRQVAYLYGDQSAVNINSVRVVNIEREAQDSCVDLSAFKPDGKAFTTDFEVTVGHQVDFTFYRSNNCDPTSERRSVRLTVTGEHNKYFYVTRVAV